MKTKNDVKIKRVFNHLYFRKETKSGRILLLMTKIFSMTREFLSREF